MVNPGIPTDIFNEQQKALKAEFAAWYKQWESDRSHLDGKFIFALSLLRAMEVNWKTISDMLGINRDTFRRHWFTRVYPTRDDIQRYAKAESIAKEAAMGELRDLWQSICMFDTALDRQVIYFHNLGASWRTIGKVTHLTRQGAQRRWARAHRLTIIDSEGRQSMMTVPRTSAGSGNADRSSG